MRTIIVVVITLLSLAGCVTTGDKKVEPKQMAEGYYLRGQAYFQEENYDLNKIEPLEMKQDTL